MLKRNGQPCEHTVPDYPGRLTDGAVPEVVEGNDGSRWEIVAPLLRTRRSDVLWCKRHVEGRETFAVIERFDPNSPLAKGQGACEVQLTGNDAKALLQEFVEGQRGALQLYANDLAATAEERAAEKYPGQDLSRVVKALSQRCTKRISVEQRVVPLQTRKQTTGMHV